MVNVNFSSEKKKHTERERERERERKGEKTANSRCFSSCASRPSIYNRRQNTFDLRNEIFILIIRSSFVHKRSIIPACSSAWNMASSSDALEQHAQRWSIYSFMSTAQLAFWKKEERLSLSLAPAIPWIKQVGYTRNDDIFVQYWFLFIKDEAEKTPPTSLSIFFPFFLLTVKEHGTCTVCSAKQDFLLSRSFRQHCSEKDESAMEKWDGIHQIRLIDIKYLLSVVTVLLIIHSCVIEWLMEAQNKFSSSLDCFRYWGNTFVYLVVWETVAMRALVLLYYCSLQLTIVHGKIRDWRVFSMVRCFSSSFRSKSIPRLFYWSTRSAWSASVYRWLPEINAEGMYFCMWRTKLCFCRAPIRQWVPLRATVWQIWASVGEWMPLHMFNRGEMWRWQSK